MSLQSTETAQAVEAALASYHRDEISLEEAGGLILTALKCPHCQEHQQQASYWKNQAKDTERLYKSLLLEKKELVSRIERMRKF